jgi:LacI family transcriptional regulator
LLASSIEYPTIRARHDSFLSSLQDIGIAPQPDWFITGLSADIIGGSIGIDRLHGLGPLPTAIICENDWMALGAMRELERLGLNVPKDISLVGHDDLWICEQLNPQLTSIRRPEQELVSQAIDLLVDQIDRGANAEPQEVLVEGKMVWRHSAGPAPERLRLGGASA